MNLRVVILANQIAIAPLVTYSDHEKKDAGPARTLNARFVRPALAAGGRTTKNALENPPPGDPGTRPQEKHS